jgi:hypothetical protein
MSLDSNEALQGDTSSPVEILASFTAFDWSMASMAYIPVEVSQLQFPGALLAAGVSRLVVTRLIMNTFQWACDKMIRKQT